MRSEPATKRVIAFVDGQNLFHAAREAFGSTHPDCDPLALSREISSGQNWDLVETRFYTGIPDPADNAFWHHFWTRKLQALSRHGVVVFSRPTSRNRRGINGTDWIRLDRGLYESCRDTRDYRT